MFLREVVEPCTPVVLRGLDKEWPLVQAGRRSPLAAGRSPLAAGRWPLAVQDHLMPLDAGGQIEAFFGAPAIEGKYFYTDDLKSFNFERRRMRFREALQTIVSSVGHTDASSVYMGSVPTNDYLPGFSLLNKMPLLDPAIGARVWIGHAANVSAHYDTLDNLACVAVGTRRFTRYAPELIGQLYVGPIDNTMAGQPVSLAASSPPDSDRFPLFEKIRDQALVAELQAGDALYLPKLWWHKVESTAAFNVLVNLLVGCLPRRSRRALDEHVAQHDYDR